MMYGALLPHAFTLGNLFCGFLALHFIFNAAPPAGSGSFVPAAWLIVLGAVLDKMDGLIARRMGKDSKFGVELDSLVDVCTFGVAPAVMIYQSYLRSPWGLALAFLYLVCGALRLARFNVMSQEHGKSAYYMGLPIPVAAVTLTQFVVFTKGTWQSGTVPPSLVLLAASMVLILAALMVSPFSYDSLPDLRATGLVGRARQGFLFGGIALVLYDDGRFLFIPAVIYMLSGVYRWIASLFHDEVTQHA